MDTGRCFSRAGAPARHTGAGHTDVGTYLGLAPSKKLAENEIRAVAGGRQPFGNLSRGGSIGFGGAILLGFVRFRTAP